MDKREAEDRFVDAWGRLAGASGVSPLLGRIPALNFVRAAEWLNGTPRARTRHSRFADLIGGFA